MCRSEISALREYLGPEMRGRSISDAQQSVSLTDILGETCLGGRLHELVGRSVLLAVEDQLISAIEMTEVDGVAWRMLLCPPGLNSAEVQSLIEDADIDVVVTDQPARWMDAGVYLVVAARLPEPALTKEKTTRATEWLMLTSGTSGLPKIVRHTLDGLAGAITAEGPARHPNATWATFYDIRRYGGLQIFLRAVIGGGSMVLSDAGESVADHIARLRARGVTHISGTPSHWRKVLMSGAAANFSPRYVRLSGEIADQAVLDGLARTFPHASIGHAYASTEAGVGFAVDDGREGFPADLIGPSRDGVEMKVVDGSLRIRSPRAARAYIGAEAPQLTDADGFVDTGDMVELRGERYHFVGRRGGIINIGGLKVHPEEIEAVINRHPSVRAALVKGRKSPITGAIVVAEVVLATPASDEAALKAEILAACRRDLAPHKSPTSIRFVPALAMTAGGKLERAGA